MLPHMTIPQHLLRIAIPALLRSFFYEECIRPSDDCTRKPVNNRAFRPRESPKPMKRLFLPMQRPLPRAHMLIAAPLLQSSMTQAMRLAEMKTKG
jgi:hypothetical protein